MLISIIMELGLLVFLVHLSLFPSKITSFLVNNFHNLGREPTLPREAAVVSVIENIGFIEKPCLANRGCNLIHFCDYSCA